MPDTRYSCRLCTFEADVERAAVVHVEYHHSDVVDEPEDVVEVVEHG